MEDFNIYGWSAIHEASYKGYSNAVTRFINYAKETQKMYLVELKTIDELKATPLLIASLGGHLDCIKIFVNSGAILTETIKYKNKYQHGIVEIAVIRQDINVLMYLYENFNNTLNLAQCILKLMKNEENDDEIRASIGRTLELVTDKNLDGVEAKLRDELLDSPEFGKLFTLFLKQSNKNDEALASCILIMLNIFHIDSIRDLFNRNNGLNYLLESLDLQNQSLTLEIYTKQSNECETAENVLAILDKFENCNLVIASLGKAFAELTKYTDCLNVIMRENCSEKLIGFIKLLFDGKVLYRKLIADAAKLRLNRDNKVKKTILFEQFIHSYLIALGNLVYSRRKNQEYFNSTFLFEHTMNLWFLINPPQLTFQQVSQNESRLSSDSSQYYKVVNVNKSTRSSNFSLQNSLLPSIASARSHYTDVQRLEQIRKYFPFDFVPLKFNETSSLTSSSIIEPAVTPNLVKLLKLSIIESIGKVLYENIELKRAYLYSTGSHTHNIKYLNKHKNWYNLMSSFVNMLVDFLEPNRSVDREVRITILQFIVNIFKDDRIAFEKLIDFKNPSKSSLLKSMKNLLRKSVALSIREETMRTIWSISGKDDEYHTQNEKLFLFKAITAQKFVDTVFDSDYLSLIALKALSVIASAPPYREKNDKLIKGTEEISRSHAIAAFIRLFKTTDEELLINLVQTISACCVSIGYENNYKNQMTFIKLGTVQFINDICQKRKNISKKLKVEAYLCLSSLSINNNTVRKLIYKNFNNEMNGLIQVLLMMLFGIEDAKKCEEEISYKLDDAELDKFELRIKAGLALSAFCYHNDEFRNELVVNFEKIPWRGYTDVLDYLLMQENRAKTMTSLGSDKHLRVVKLKCLLAFQMAALYNIINSTHKKVKDEENNLDSYDDDDDDGDDPRAIGMKILIDLVQYSSNSYIRTLAIDCICRLINTDRTLVEPIVTIDAIEVLCKQLENVGIESKKSDISENEIGNCAITLAILTDLSAEARRRILKIARKVPKIFKYLKYYNKELNLDLLEQWKHYQNLMDMLRKKQPFNKVARKTSFLPLLPKKSEALPVLKNIYL